MTGCRICGATIRLGPSGWGHVRPQTIRNGKKPHRAVPVKAGTV